jgi:hemerythrin-like metal-binding protein
MSGHRTAGAEIMGNYVAWKPYYSVGDPALDAEHRQILGFIDELYEAMAAGQHSTKTIVLLDQLVQYTMTHFQHEERIMRECDYPQLPAHRAEHERMKQRTLDLRTNVDLATTRDFLQFLKDWWTNHIQDVDKAYSPYLAVMAH